MTDLAALTVDDFTALVGERLAIVFDDADPIALELAAANGLDPGAPAVGDDGRRTPFELLFHGPADPVLPQRMYRLTSDALGTLDIFIVPVERSDDHATYQAVFG